MRTPCRALLLGALLVTIADSSVAEAQDGGRATLDATAGWVGFADDSIVSEGMVGGSGRIYLTPRLAVGPEVVFIRGTSHSHYVVTGNVTFDFVRPAGGRGASATPYIVLGAGAFWTRQQFPRGVFTSNEGAFTAGVGVRVPIGERVTVGAEARLGWELHARINGVVGWRLGR
ncbi:MAG: outer membrane beta-barrel protein [Vicinamibacterales bacterium]